MITKTKILKAVQKGIKSGFKFSPDSIVDDSSYINFEKSKINNIESLNIKKINEEFKNFIDANDFVNAQKYIQRYGTNIIPETFKPVAYSKNKFKKLINMLINNCGIDIDLNWIDTSSITDMSHLFESSYFIGDISNWDVSNVTNMSYMFYAMDFNGDISNWNVSNVKNMKGMFGYSKFNNDISQWNVSNVKDMSYMFYHSQFDNDISNWKTDSLSIIYNMFEYSKFNHDISNWNVSKIKNFAWLFHESCFNNDISKWNVSNATNMRYMFADSKFNNNISNWKISSKCIITGIFDNCPILEEYEPLFLG